MNKILTVATAGLKDDQLSDTAHTKYPRVDYIELKNFQSTDILDYTAYRKTKMGGSFRYLETSLRSDIYLSLLSLIKERKYDLAFAMSERVGIPLAWLRRFTPGPKPRLIAMFTCWSTRQEKVITTFNLFPEMDAIIVHCQSMKQHFIKLGVPPEKIHVIQYSVDQNFFSPVNDVEQQPGFIMSLGETRSRDYATLFKAIDGLPVNLYVAASGSWYAREKNKRINSQPPENVHLTGRLSHLELRKHYAQSQFVVLPIYNEVFSAGATVAMEAACMGRAVIATRSQGIVDYIIDGETGILVEPNDVEAWQHAIQDLLTHPEKARRLGQNARRRVEQELNLDIYVKRIAQLLQTYE